MDGTSSSRRRVAMWTPCGPPPTISHFSSGGSLLALAVLLLVVVGLAVVAVLKAWTREAWTREMSNVIGRYCSRIFLSND